MSEVPHRGRLVKRFGMEWLAWRVRPGMARWGVARLGAARQGWLSVDKGQSSGRPFFSATAALALHLSGDLQQPLAFLNKEDAKAFALVRH